MFLNLFYGRIDKGQTMGGPGLEGPSFEVFSVQGIYTSNIKVLTEESGELEFFWYFEDMIKYDGVYYGAWSVTESPRNEVQSLNHYKMNTQII
jgi:hypothetical protein